MSTSLPTSTTSPRFSTRVGVRAGAPAIDGLDQAFGVLVPGAFDDAACARWALGVRAAQADWTADFGGEQFSLGRAFYTHLEQGRTRAYFADASASDARVERAAPGLQGAMLDLLARLVGGAVRRRRGWCGPGVHIFPAGEKVSREGGVVHFDLEGLSELERDQGLAAVSVVVMLQAPEAGGGLRLWDVIYDGEACEEELEVDDGSESEVLPYRTGDAALIDSYRLHCIQPFTGSVDRISATVHAVQRDARMWEAWF